MRSLHRKRSFIERLVRDGAFYYIVVLGLAVCIAAATFSSITDTATDSLESLGQIMAPFFNLVPNMLASRIFLNTHAYCNADCWTAGSTLRGSPEETLQDINFTRATGDIASPLRSRWYDADILLDTEEEHNATPAIFYSSGDNSNLGEVQDVTSIAGSVKVVARPATSYLLSDSETSKSFMYRDCDTTTITGISSSGTTRDLQAEQHV